MVVWQNGQKLKPHKAVAIANLHPDVQPTERQFAAKLCSNRGRFLRRRVPI
jgi:hypothetical protein